ncbi:MAG: hypothetical protein HOJ16_07775 [Candidatus Peribacter sp.]|jgi:hypothetical protein|nr:hypothetical protein [Candidatus Peribacter sp.]
MSLITKFRKLPAGQLDLTKIVSGSLAGRGSFVGVNLQGEAVLVEGGNFADKYKVRQAFSESPNGTRTEFTAPSSYVEGSEMVFRDGMLMNSGSSNDYVLTPPNQVTFNSEDPPNSDETLMITYVAS